MTDKKTEALKLVLEAFEKLNAEKSYWWQEVEIDTVEALEKAESICKQVMEEQPAQQDIPKIGCVNHDCDKCKAQQQEPVAWKDRTYGNLHHQDFGNSIPLYTSPPASKPWLGLTEQERNDLEDYCEMIIGKAAFEAIEAKLLEKNT